MGRGAASEWSRIKEADRVARERRAAEQGRAEAEMRSVATPQTIAKRKLRRDAVAKMAADGHVRPNQVRAAAEILLVFTSITRAVMARSARYGEASGGGDRDWMPTLTRAYRERYSVWRDAAGAQMVGRVTLAELVFFVVVDNDPLRVAAARAGIHHRTAGRGVQKGLFDYCRIAGWLEQKQVEAEMSQAA